MKKVMVVDDDKEFLTEIAQVLESSGYNVITISHAEETLPTAQSEKPDIVLLDLKMEGGSGFKIADKFRRSEALKDIPIIAITGVYTEKEHKIPMRAVGFKECLIKPVNPLDVIAVIERIERRSL